MAIRSKLVRALGLLGALALFAAACSSGGGSESADEQEANPSSPPPAELGPVTVTGPVTGGVELVNAALQDLAAVGYVEQEYFIEGDATSYAMEGERTPDGMWAVEEDDTAAYRTRISVRRPADPADFSGVVVVEWLNVTAGRDGDPDWGYLHPELIREGHAWVGVSAQAVGVVGGEALLEGVALEGGLAGSDPERYGTLDHPGDRFAFDIFSQAGAAIWNPDGPDPLGGLEPTHVIAAGESQAAFFLTTYLNAVHPTVGVFGGFLVHSRGGGAPDVSGASLDESLAGEAIEIRTDLDEPVLIFETETDLTVLEYFPARQDDTESVRLWEAAGTAHADSYLLVEVYGIAAEADVAGILDCPAPLNDGPQHEVLQAGFHHLVDWVRDGTLPPESPRLDVSGGDPPVIGRDEHGNALGGIRTPPVDVPVATLSGDPVEGASAFCFLFGSTTPFDAETLAELYPSHDEYVAAFTAAADEAVAAGFLLQVDADEMIAGAEATDFAA